MAQELAKLVDSEELIKFVAMDDFLAVVNQTPPEIFIENHPMAKGVKYIPIDKTEWTLTKIFQDWYVEVLDAKQMLNSIAVTVRVFYFHPIKREWRHQDGLGAVAIQTDKGENASNMGAIKSDAITKALPAAKSFAIKDACDHIGAIFGKDLNRKNAMNFVPSYGTDEVKDEIAKKKEDLRKSLEAK